MRRCEKNGIRIVAVVRKYTQRHDVVIGKKGVFWSTLYKFVVFVINSVYFVKNLCFRNLWNKNLLLIHSCISYSEILCTFVTRDVYFSSKFGMSSKRSNVLNWNVEVIENDNFHFCSIRLFYLTFHIYKWMLCII